MIWVMFMLVEVNLPIMGFSMISTSSLWIGGGGGGVLRVGCLGVWSKICSCKDY